MPKLFNNFFPSTLCKKFLKWERQGGKTRELKLMVGTFNEFKFPGPNELHHRGMNAFSEVTYEILWIICTKHETHMRYYDNKYKTRKRGYCHIQN